MRATFLPGLVRRLLTQEAAGSQDQNSLLEAAERVSDKLRDHLSQRIGTAGFRTLLARALTLATASFPSLSTVQVGEEGSLVGLHGVPGTVSPAPPSIAEPDDAVERFIGLIAQLLGLLVTFIGEELTWRILGTVWPELGWDDAIDEADDAEKETL